jgi:PAS domain S-box-containing protein
LNGDLVVSTAPLRNGSEHPFGAVFVLRDVTESKQAAEALRQREEMLNGFFEWAPDAILVVDGAGRITRVNKQIEVIFGYSREELIGKPVEDLMPERFRQHHLQHRAAYLDKPYIRFMSDSINLLGQRKDGSEFPTDITLSLLKTAGENFIVTFIRDTTERRRAERRLAAQHAVTRILAESPTLNEATPRILQAICESLEWDEGAIWVVDDAANVLRCVEVWHAPRAQIEAFVAMSRQITFAPGVGLPGRVWASSQPAWIEDVTRDANFPRAPIAAQVGLHGAFAFPILSGGEVMSVIEFFSHKIQQPDDDLLKMMSTIGSQIGQFMERKRASESLRQAHREINHLLGAISSILISVGQDYRITRWSTVAEQTFGMASADAVGRAIDQCGIQWDASIVIEGLRECQTENEPVRLRDIRYTRPDGKEGLLGITLNPIRDDAGTPIGFLLLGVDVTERRFLEAQLTQTQKLESIGRLAAGIAHEINTPTQYVGDNTRFLQDAFGDLRQLMEKYGNLLTASKNGGVSPELINEVESAAQEADVEYLLEEIPQAISQSLEGVDRVAHIVRAMKEFSHPGVEEKTSVDLNKAIESTITVARNEWKYVADMVTELDASLPLVPCLPGDINQVFLNIIVNAAHAIADVVGDGSEDKGTIAIATRRDGDWVEVRISDTGKGIPESVRSRIFDPFFTTKEVGKGTGQGLAIARSVVVDKHGGTITFETEAGKGTTFIVRLPLADCS